MMRGVTRFELVLIAILLLAAVGLVLPEIQRARVRVGHRPEVLCRHYLHMIGLGLHNYHDIHGSFPPTWAVGPDGTTRHSWRVLAFPNLDEMPLYRQYQFDEPWDGDNNRSLHGELSGLHPFHVCPSSDVDAADRGRTSYLVIVGPQTAWRGGQPVSLTDITDGTDQTILLVEVANSDVNWFEPRDLQWDEMSFRLNDPDGLSPSSRHAHVFWFGADTPYVKVLMVDGSVKKLPVDTPPETLKALLTINGGEDVGDPFLP